MRGNPDNADPYLMMSECLVRLGVRPEGYSPQDYKEEFEAGVFQSIDSDDPGNAEKFWSCNADPAHAQ